jgi:hypothetical protein
MTDEEQKERGERSEGGGAVMSDDQSEPRPNRLQDLKESRWLESKKDSKHDEGRTQHEYNP